MQRPEHFLTLNFAPNEWAITPQLAGIHCPKPEDFTVYEQLAGGSPLSDLLLYGATANVAAAIAAGVRLGIGLVAPLVVRTCRGDRP
jgi:5-methylthioadenosine/S-adenosylhomocysteine deaminase